MKNTELTRRIREQRKRNGFSQEELADRAGVSLRTIQRIENGQSEPLGDTLKRISGALNVNIDELVDWTIKEDKMYLKQMNLSALSFIVFPLLGVIVPLVMWVSQKEKLKDLNKVGRDLINFEISWVIALFLGLIVNPIMKASFSAEPLSLRYLILTSGAFLAVMYLINLGFILFNTVRIHHEKEVKYFPRVRFFRG